MPTKQKTKRSGKRNQPTARRSRSQRRPGVIGPPPSLQQGLIELASDGAQSFLWVGVTLVIIAAIAAAAFGIWSLRPVPNYASEGVEAGSPFGVTFRIENTNAWFPMSNLRVRCVVAHGGASEMPPVEASDLRFPGGTSDLEPGQSATFKCPFRALPSSAGGDELGVALRSEIYFHSEYDLPVVHSFRVTSNKGPFILNTRFLPPRWTGKPMGD